MSARVYEQYLTLSVLRGERFLSATLYAQLLTYKTVSPQAECLANIGAQLFERSSAASSTGFSKLFPPLNNYENGVLIHCVRDLIVQFHREEHLQTIASSAALENIEALVNHFDLVFFSKIVSADQFPGKPGPAVFIETAKRLDILVNHCVVIEDSLPGIDAANKGKLKCIAVASTFPIAKLISSILVTTQPHVKSH